MGRWRKAQRANALGLVSRGFQRPYTIHLTLKVGLNLSGTVCNCALRARQAHGTRGKLFA